MSVAEARDAWSRTVAFPIMAKDLVFECLGTFVLPLSWWGRLWARLWGRRTTWYMWKVTCPAFANKRYPWPSQMPTNMGVINVEGAAGIGKTTLLSKLPPHRVLKADLADVFTDMPQVARTGGSSAVLYHLWREACAAEKNKTHELCLVDRSSWLSNDIYTAYATGHLFLHGGPVQKFLENVERIAVLDNPALSDAQIAERIRRRGGMDASAPLSYTQVTRWMFDRAADWYGLMKLDLETFEKILPVFFALRDGDHVPEDRYQEFRETMTARRRRSST